MARHRSPGGRVSVSAYLPTPDARRMHDEGRHTAPSHVVAMPMAADADADTVTIAVPPAAPPTAAFTVSPPGTRFETVHPSATEVPSTVIPSPNNRRAAHRRISTTTAKGHTVVSATAALGAVVTGGLMASQASGSLSMADASDASRAGTTMMAASAITPLQMHAASSEAPLNPTRLADTGAVTSLLPITGARDSFADNRDLEALHKGEQLAAQAAAAHAMAAKEAMVINGGGDLDDWIGVALNKLGLDESLASGVKRIIMKESRGNPNAINLWDSNAMAGRPSQGLMQVIPNTFRKYVLPELADKGIKNPVANITAGIRYMIANYGVSTLRAGGRYSGGSYVGY